MKKILLFMSMAAVLAVGCKENKDADVVRHELVRKIINAYDRYYRKYPEEMQEKRREDKI